MSIEFIKIGSQFVQLEKVTGETGEKVGKLITLIFFAVMVSLVAAVVVGKVWGAI